jgi:hypothetical protein
MLIPGIVPGQRVRVLLFGLTLLPTAIVGGLLVVYFRWRAKLVSGIRDERHEY